MSIWIVLLRGINVGGNNPLPMASLQQLLIELGCENVQTYIASGNVVLESAVNDGSLLETAIAESIEGAHGFQPEIMAIPAAEFVRLARANPYPEGQSDAKSLHLYFSSAPLHQEAQAFLEDLAAADEQVQVTERCVYLHAPSGIGRSKLAAGMERVLGISITGRNWRTVEKLVALTGEVGQP